MTKGGNGLGLLRLQRKKKFQRWHFLTDKDFILLSQVQLWKPLGENLKSYKVELVPAKHSESESGGLHETKRPANIIPNWRNISPLSMYYCTSFPTITLTQRAMFSILGMIFPSYWSDKIIIVQLMTHCFWSKGNYYVCRCSVHRRSAWLKKQSNDSLGHNSGDSIFVPVHNKTISATEKY